MVNMKYRKPILSIRDRHILIELDADEHDDYNIGHLLKKAYLNNKAPYEYDEMKQYIRDIIFGKHNSIYVSRVGNPNQLASASVLNPLYLYLHSSPIYNDLVWYNALYDPNGACQQHYAFQNSCSSVSFAPGSYGWGPVTWNYNNGVAQVWTPLYTSIPFTSSPSPSSQMLIIGSNISYNGYSLTSCMNSLPYTYAYASYISATNPLTLSTYYYWQLPSNASSQSYSYIYFTLPTFLGNAIPYAWFGFIPLFYSTGNFSFTPSTTYITMWQWTYQ